MEATLSDFDTRFIQMQLSKLSDFDIAAMIDKPEELVHEKIEELTGAGTVKLSYSQRLLEKRKLKEKTAAAKNLITIQNKQEQPVKIRYDSKVNATERKNREERQRLPTRIVDRSQLILVRIDSKTQLEVMPGTDIEKFKQQYLAKKNASLNIRAEKEKTSHFISKFK